MSQLQVYGAGGRPVNIVYSEAMPIALNLGYRVLELDVWGSSSTPSQVGAANAPVASPSCGLIGPGLASPTFRPNPRPHPDAPPPDVT